MKRTTLTQLTKMAQLAAELQAQECCSYHYSYKCQLTKGHEGLHRWQHNKLIKYWTTLNLTQRQCHILTLLPDKGMRFTDILNLLKVSKRELHYDLDVLRKSGLVKGGKDGRKVLLSNVGREESLK